MNIKYFGINNALIDPFFKNTEDIAKLIYENKDNIINNYLNPVKIKTVDNKDIYYPNEIELENGIKINADSFYNNGIIYNISNENISNQKDTPHTEAKLIVGNNMINLFIDFIDDYYNIDNSLLKDLRMNIEKEKVFTCALGKKIEFPKLYGTRSNNRFLKILDKKQIETEKQVLEILFEDSMNLLKKLDNKKILTKSRF